MQGFCTHGGWGMRSEKDSTLVMKGLLAIYQLWPKGDTAVRDYNKGFCIIPILPSLPLKLGRLNLKINLVDFFKTTKPQRK